MFTKSTAFIDKSKQITLLYGMDHINSTTVLIIITNTALCKNTKTLNFSIFFSLYLYSLIDEKCQIMPSVIKCYYAVKRN